MQKNKIKTNSLNIRILLGIEILIATKLIFEPGITRSSLIVVGVLILLYDLVKNIIKKIKNKDFLNDDTIFLLIVIIMLFEGYIYTSLFILLLYILLNKFILYIKKFETKTTYTAKLVHLIVKNKVKDIEPIKLKVGDIIEIRNDEIIPVDIILLEKGKATNYFLNGDNSIIEKEKNSEFLSGSICKCNKIVGKVTNVYKDSKAEILTSIINKTDNYESQIGKTINKVIKLFRKVILIISLLLIFAPILITKEIDHNSLNKGLIVMSLGYFTSILELNKIAFRNGINKLLQNKIIVRGNIVIEKVKKLSTIVVEKTGVLTIGDLNIRIESKDEEALLYYLNYAEYNSTHKIANAIKKYKNIKVNEKYISNYVEIQGQGIKVKIQGKDVIVGNYSLLKENGIKVNKVNKIGTIIYVVVDNNYLGYVLISDMIKLSVKSIIERISKHKNVVVFSGDNEQIVRGICEELNIKEYHSNLLDQDKLFWLNYLDEQNKGLIGYIGDSKEDIICLSNVDVGITVNGITNKDDLMLSDAILIDNDLSYIVKLIDISNKVMKKVYNNIILLVMFKIIIITLVLLNLIDIAMIIIIEIILALLLSINVVRRDKDE